MDHSPSMIILSAVASTLEMAICLVCSIQLFRHWKGKQDPTRLFLGACGALFVLQSLYKVVSITLFPDNNIYSEMMDRRVVFYGLLGQIITLVYPLLVIGPKNRLKLSMLFIPWLLLLILYSLTPEWTSLQSFSDIQLYIGRGNVILRLVTLACYLPYLGALLVLVSRRMRDLPFSPPMFTAYGLCVLVITLLHFAFFFTGNLWFHILHQVGIGAFFFVVTVFDLEDRLVPRGSSTVRISEHKKTESAENKPEPEPDPAEIMVSSGRPLWERICQAMDEEEIWRDPSLSVESLARHCGTNVPYLSNCIKKETGWGANEYINRKRIGYVCQLLEENPALNLQDVFYEAGYRARTTAWRNFREIMGESPSEFRVSKQ